MASLIVSSMGIDHYHPPRPENVDMRRRMVVETDHDPQTVDAQDREHDELCENQSGLEIPLRLTGYPYAHVDRPRRRALACSRGVIPSA
jgi:hypothetical protein